MRRRKVLIALPTVALAGCTEAIEETPIDIPLGEEENVVPPEVSGEISRVEWINDRTWLEVYLNAEHDTEAIWLTHTTDSTILYITDAPRSEGPIEIPILSAIACDDADYPSTTFEITAAEGRPASGYTPETTGEAEVPLPDGYFDRLSEGDESNCMTVEED